MRVRTRSADEPIVGKPVRMAARSVPGPPRGAGVRRRIAVLALDIGVLCVSGWGDEGP